MRFLNAKSVKNDFYLPIKVTRAEFCETHIERVVDEDQGDYRDRCMVIGMVARVRSRGGRPASKLEVKQCQCRYP